MESKFTLVIERVLKSGNQRYKIFEDGMEISEGFGKFEDFFEITKASFNNITIEYTNNIDKYNFAEGGN